jgi:hypothetical protein
MSSIMRWRNGLMGWVGAIMAGLLSENEADCLVPQDRKPRLCSSVTNHRRPGGASYRASGLVLWPEAVFHRSDKSAPDLTKLVRSGWFSIAKAKGEVSLFLCFNVRNEIKMAPYAGITKTNTSPFKSLRSLLFPVDPS